MTNTRSSNYEEMEDIEKLIQDLELRRRQEKEPKEQRRQHEKETEKQRRKQEKETYQSEPQQNLTSNNQGNEGSQYKGTHQCTGYRITVHGEAQIRKRIFIIEKREGNDLVY